MVEFRKGQKAKLSDLTPGTDLYVGLRLDAPGLSFDISCFGLDTQDRLSDDRYFVFFNQPKSPEESIQLLGEQAGDQESFRVTLDRVPQQIGKLVFTATVDGQGQMSQVASGCIRIAVGGQEVVRYSFTGAEFSTERAVMIADIYRKEPGVWRFAAVGQGFDGGLKALLENFGGEVTEEDETPAAPEAPAPSFAPPPPQPMAAHASPPPPPMPAHPAAPGPFPAPAAPGATGHGGPAGVPARHGIDQYREVQGQTRWVAQNHKMVRAAVGAGHPKVIAKQGCMVAYQGDVSFKFQGQSLRGRFENRMTGQSLELMRCEGDGEVFLADEASYLHLVELAGHQLCVNAANVLAWDEGMEWEPMRIEGQGIPGGGLFAQTFKGNGSLVVKTKGTPLVLPVHPGAPTFADSNAIVAWTQGMQVSASTQVRVRRTAYPGHSGETVALQFRGMQGHFIVVQPYEA